MTLIYSQEHRLLKDSVQEMLADKSPVAAQRKLRDEQVSACFDSELWQSIIEMGWSAIPFPEELDGLDFGYAGLAIVFEQIGANLSASPLLSSIVLGGSVVILGGSNEQKQSIIPNLISGEKRFEREETKGSYHLLERAYGHFTRSIPLNYEVDAESANASYKNGVLRLTLDKKPEQRRRQIHVN